MKITFLVPGSGSNYYCGNCQRDTLYVSSLSKIDEIQVSVTPLYLPPDEEHFDIEIDKEIFFGAVSLYLKEKLPIFRMMPGIFDRVLDSSSLLGLAAKKAGTTNPKGLEETTLSMIRSDDPSRDKEARRLVDYINRSNGTDIIHISNALILGLAVQIKHHLGKPVVCSLQNEDDWIEEMDESYQRQAWDLIAKEGSQIDAFVASSEYYKKLFIEKTGIAADKISVVHTTLDIPPEYAVEKKAEELSIGFYNRLNRMNGLDKLIDAFIMLKKRDRYSTLKLRLCGGYTNDEEDFVSQQMLKLKKEGFDHDVVIYPSFTGEQKQTFFSCIDLLCVPVRKPDAFGLYLLEAISRGIPVVQPKTGGFPEIIDITRGGVTYFPDTVERLAETLDTTLSDREQLRKTGQSGRENLNKRLTVNKMAKSLFEIYRKVKEAHQKHSGMIN